MSPRTPGWIVAAASCAAALLAVGCVAGATFVPATPLPSAGIDAPATMAPDTAPPAQTAAATTSPAPAEMAAPSPSLSCDCPCASVSAAVYPGVDVRRVTLEGGRFFTRATEEADIRRGRGLVVPPETVVDGVFADRFQQWDEGAVWWETPLGAPIDAQWIRIDLDGIWTLDSAIVQADNNDAYRLAYRDMASGDWMTLIAVPPEYAFGMITRPDQYDDSARLEFFRAVTTDALRFEAQEGDGMYAVSEIQVFGTRAGEDATSPAP